MTEAFSRWQQRQGVEMGEIEKERSGRIECERQYQAKVEEVASLLCALDRIAEIAADLDKRSLMLECERAQLLEIRRLANYSASDPNDLGLHTMPEYLTSPYTPRDAE